MRTKILTGLLLLPVLLYGFEIDSSWQIVCPPAAVPTERKAAEETAAYIRKVSGLDLKIVPAAAAGKQAVIIRKDPKMAEEAWNVRRIAEGVLISGGEPNGILYAAYEFIEKGLGCRFLAFDAEYVPSMKKIILPDDFKLAGKPFFTGRGIYRGGGVKNPVEYHVRMKLNGAFFAGPEWGWYDRIVDHQSGHTYYLYASKFPKDKPEWLSLDSEGKRLRPVSGVGPGQLCLSNLEARDFIFKEMKARIERERAELKKAGRPFSKRISLTANDNTQKCVCTNCLAAAKKYGGYSGLMLEFTNDLATRLEKVFPEMQVETFAYEYTEDAPTAGNIAPRKNVGILIAQLGDEFYSVSKICRDSLRPLTHPNNKVALKQFMEWGKYKTPIRMWDYWRLFQQRRNFPYTVIPALSPNLRLYADHNVSRIFAESEMSGEAVVCGRCFSDLTNYLGAKLMVDPYADPEPIIADFMKHYYGPAAEPMNKLLDHLIKAMEKEKSSLGKIGIGACYLTTEFFEDAEKLFSEAEKRVKNDAVLLARVSEERIWYDEAALDLYSHLKLKISRKALLERYSANLRKAFQRYGTEKYLAKNRKRLEEHLEFIGMQVPIPEQFKGKSIFDFPVFTMRNVEWVYTRLINDPESAGGIACILTVPPKKSKDQSLAFHSKDFQVGVYSPVLKKSLGSKIFSRDEIFKDEKYHWYFLGKYTLAPGCFIWVHWSWMMPFKCLSSVYNPIMPEAQYGIWLSVKLQGPAYVPGSKKENAVVVDRIIVTRE